VAAAGPGERGANDRTGDQAAPGVAVVVEPVVVEAVVEAVVVAVPEAAMEVHGTLDGSSEKMTGVSVQKQKYLRGGKTLSK
jgi:hypothetical protein